MIYAEVSLGFGRIEVFDHAIDPAGFIVRPIPRAALFLAGKAFEAYRRRASWGREDLTAFPTLRIVHPARGDVR